MISVTTDLVLTLDEVAALLRIGRNTAYRAAQRGDLPAVRVGKRWIVPRARIEAMLNTSANVSNAN